MEQLSDTTILGIREGRYKKIKLLLILLTENVVLVFPILFRFSRFKIIFKKDIYLDLNTLRFSIYSDKYHERKLNL